MTTEQTLLKSDVVLEVIFNHDQEVPSCQHKFSEIMDEIISMWRNSEKIGKVEVFPNHDLSSNQQQRIAEGKIS